MTQNMTDKTPKPKTNRWRRVYLVAAVLASLLLALIGIHSHTHALAFGGVLWFSISLVTAFLQW